MRYYIKIDPSDVYQSQELKDHLLYYWASFPDEAGVRGYRVPTADDIYSIKIPLPTELGEKLRVGDFIELEELLDSRYRASGINPYHEQLVRAMPYADYVVDHRRFIPMFGAFQITLRPNLGNM